MGKYDPIWRTLKERGSVTLAIAEPLQPRVIKGVIHAKDHDLAYKLQLSEVRKHAKLTYTSEQAKVTIVLTTYINTKDLTLEAF
jgi:hypothetical protein